MMMNDDNGEGKVKEKKKNQRARTDQAQRRVAGGLTRSPGAFWGGNSTEMERSREAQSFEIATHTTAPPTLVEWALRSGPGLLGSAEPQPRVLPPPPDLFLLQRLPLAGTHLYSLALLFFLFFFLSFVLQALSFILVSCFHDLAHACRPLYNYLAAEKSNLQSELSKYSDAPASGQPGNWKKNSESGVFFWCGSCSKNPHFLLPPIHYLLFFLLVVRDLKPQVQL